MNRIQGVPHPVTDPARMPDDSVRSSMSGSQWLTDLKYRWPARYRSSWFAFVFLVMAVLVLVPKALNSRSINLVTALSGALAIAAIGQTLIVMLGSLDLSISAIISVAAGMSVKYGGEGSSLPTLLLSVLVIAVLLSLVNGVLISVLGLNALIVTLATVGIYTGGIQLWAGQFLSMSGESPKSLQDFAQSKVLGLNTVFVSAIVLCIAMSLVLSKTRFGRQIAEVGANRRAARTLGVRVHAVELGAFALAGVFYGLAGILLAGYIGTPDVNSGSVYQLGTITVAGIAGVLFSGGPASMGSVLIASTVLRLLDQALAIRGLSAGARVVVQGLVLALAVAAMTLSGRGAATLKNMFGSARRREAAR